MSSPPPIITFSRHVYNNAFAVGSKRENPPLDTHHVARATRRKSSRCRSSSRCTGIGIIADVVTSTRRDAPRFHGSAVDGGEASSDCLFAANSLVTSAVLYYIKLGRENFSADSLIS